LKDANLVVETLDEAEGDFVLGVAVSSNTVPVTVDHRGELLVGLETLPFKCRLPVLEEAPRSGLAPVVPQLPEGFLEQIGDVESVVGLQQLAQRTPPFQGQIVAVRQQRVFLALDDAAILATQPRVLALSDLIQGLSEMAHDVELVEQDAGLRSVAVGGVAKGLPHVHHHEPDPLAFHGPQPLVAEVEARFGAVPPTKPDRTVPFQVAHHYAIGVPLADRDLVDADRPRGRRPGSSELLSHVLLVELLDGLPIQVQLASDVLDGRGPAVPTHEEGKALGVKGIVGEPRQLLLLHLGAAPAAHPTALDLQVDSGVSRREIPHPAQLALVDSPREPAADSTQSFFPAAQVARHGPWDRQTPHVLPPADEMRGNGTRPPTAALFPSPIHAKFFDPGKLCKTLCEKAFNSCMLKIHPPGLEKTQKTNVSFVAERKSA
jgi:hypothetical protein